MEGTTLKVRDLIGEIRQSPPSNGKRAGELEVTLPPPVALRASQELRHLNRHWVLEGEPQAPRTSTFVAIARACIPGPVRRWVKSTIARLVVGSLEPYLLDERRFLENLVRLQNDIARKSDELAEETRALAAMTGRVARWLDHLADHAALRDEFYHALTERRLELLERAARLRV